MFGQMNDSYQEPRADVPLSLRLEKYANEVFNIVKDYDNNNDKECQEQTILISTTNLEEIGKINMMTNEEIIT